MRHPHAQVAKAIYERLVKCAQAGALATETELEIEYLGGTHEILPNSALAAITLKNLREINDLQYNAQEIAFAKKLQANLAIQGRWRASGRSQMYPGR